MRKGIVVVFGKKDTSILNNFFLKSFFNKKIKICLVNNGNHHTIYNFLDEIEKSSKYDISILTLSREKGTMSAIKAGVRFLLTNEDLSLIIYTKANDILNTNLIGNVLRVSDEELFSKLSKRVLFRKVYSVKEIINYLSVSS